MVWQSSSLTTTSWLISTRRRVRYPASAVLSAVSESPFLAPLVEMKNSMIDKPSLKFDLMGNSMTSPDGFAIKPRMPPSCLIWVFEPRAPLSAII